MKSMFEPERNVSGEFAMCRRVEERF